MSGAYPRGGVCLEKRRLLDSGLRSWEPGPAFFTVFRSLGWATSSGLPLWPFHPLFLSGGPGSWWPALHLVRNSSLTNRKALNLLCPLKAKGTLESFCVDHEQTFGATWR